MTATLTTALDLDALFRSHQPQLMRALRRTFASTDRMVLEDAAQHAWLKLCEKSPDWIDPERDPIAWLYTVAANRVRRPHGRRRALESIVVDDVDAVAPGRVDAQAEQRATLAALATLKPQQRVALTCRMLGLSYDEATVATGHTYTWINRHLTEGKRALHATLAAA